MVFLVNFTKNTLSYHYNEITEKPTELGYEEVIEEKIITPEEDKKAIGEITREEVMKAAEKARLAAVFFLKGGENE